jgi:phage gp29-like protein
VVAARIQTYTVAIIAAVLFGLGVLISIGMTTTADSQAVMDQEKINRQLEQVVKALDSGDTAAAEEYLKETVKELPDGEAKTHLEVAINALQYSNDTKSPRMHVQLVQNLTG